MVGMWTLSGFADEIDDDFTTQCEVAAGLGLTYLEVRSAWGTNILDLSDEQLDTVQQILRAHGLQVSSIGSPIGKIMITDDFEPHLVRMQHAADVARRLSAPYIRLFSFFIPEGEDPDDHRDEVLRRMRALAAVAEEAGVIAVHENEKDIYGDIPRRCLDIVTRVDSPKPQAGLGSGELRPVRRPTVHRGVRRPAAAHGLHPDQGRVARRRVCRRRRGR